MLRIARSQAGAPIVKTLPGKACVPDDSPYTTGGIGLMAEFLTAAQHQLPIKVFIAR
jgi:thiamine pyrophosphate-dependent acetolactate synthase large subunit-like protein